MAKLGDSKKKIEEVKVLKEVNGILKIIKVLEYESTTTLNNEPK